MRNIVFFILLGLANFAFALDNDEQSQLEQRINELTDQIEQINHKNDVLAKKFENLSADMEFRFKELENKKAVATKTPEAASKKPADPKLAKQEYENAYGLLKEQRYEEAENALSEFLKAYPNSEYTGGAYYWLGESFMLRKRYDKAAVHYIQSFSKFPKNKKADISMLKLSAALNMLKKKKEACEMLGKLKAKNSSLSPVMQKLLQKELVQVGCK
jgi:tol-pal system protein YbgF